MTTEMVEIDKAGLAKATRAGLRAAVLLAILSAIEYFIAIEVEQPLLPLIPFILAKGWVILDSFMHIKALWHPEAH